MSESEVVCQAGLRYDSVERERDCEVVGRDGGRNSEEAGQAELELARILDCISVF